jgi:hypothetical protein
VHGHIHIKTNEEGGVYICMKMKMKPSLEWRDNVEKGGYMCESEFVRISQKSNKGSETQQKSGERLHFDLTLNKNISGTRMKGEK